MNKFVNYLLKTPRYKFIFISIITMLIWSFLASFIGHLLGITNTHKASLLAGKSNLYKFNAYVFFGPFLETFFFQFLIIESLYFLFKKNILCIVISGFTFGIIHYTNTYNITYTIAAIIAGLLFASIYMLSKKRKDIYPFLIVLLTHSSVNFVAFLINNNGVIKN